MKPGNRLSAFTHIKKKKRSNVQFETGFQFPVVFLFDMLKRILCNFPSVLSNVVASALHGWAGECRLVLKCTDVDTSRHNRVCLSCELSLFVWYFTKAFTPSLLFDPPLSLSPQAIFELAQGEQDLVEDLKLAKKVKLKKNVFFSPLH